MTLQRRILVLVGDVTTSDEATVVELAKGRGFRILSTNALKPEAMVVIRGEEHLADNPLPVPLWHDEHLKKIELPRAIPNPLAHDQIGAVLASDNIFNAAQLTKLTFAEFMRPGQGLTEQFYLRAMVLEFMIKSGIPFRDLNPAAVFYTPISTIAAFSSFARVLQDKGIVRLEILAFLTRDNLIRSGGFGATRLATINQVLQAEGLELSSGH